MGCRSDSDISPPQGRRLLRYPLLISNIIETVSVSKVRAGLALCSHAIPRSKAESVTPRMWGDKKSVVERVSALGGDPPDVVRAGAAFVVAR